MTVLTFDPARALLHRIATAEPSELPSLQREACKLLRLPVPEPERPPLTRRERDALDALGWRVARSTVAVSVDLVVSYRWAYALLKRLEGKGYVTRRGQHVGGGWVRIDEPGELARAA